MSDDKYKAACTEYAAAQRALKNIAPIIGQHIENCRQAAIREWVIANPDKEEYDAPAHAWDKSPHLADAYRLAYDDDDRGYFEHHDGNVAEFLEKTCQHCLLAHLAIQDKKAAKKRFGLAKRRITVLGGAAK